MASSVPVGAKNALFAGVTEILVCTMTAEVQDCS